MQPVGKLCVGSKNDSHLFNDLDVLYHLVKFVEDRTTRAGCRCENMVFVCLLPADQDQQMTIIAKEEKSDNNKNWPGVLCKEIIDFRHGRSQDFSSRGGQMASRGSKGRCVMGFLGMELQAPSSPATESGGAL